MMKPHALLKLTSVALLALTSQIALSADMAKDAIWTAVNNNPHRSESEIARDQYRHPEQVLRFFNIKATDRVAEVAPGAGWYTHILAPLLKDQGNYVGLQHHPAYYGKWPDWAAKLAAYPEQVAQQPELYGDRASASWLPMPEGLPVEENSVDVLLIVRTLHNWQNQGRMEPGLQQSWQILKPGGTLAVVQHRLNESSALDAETAAKNGRFKQSQVIAMIEAHGFKLVDSSEVNANPKDEQNYPKGVWTLPPTLALKEQDQDKYLAIGESDRMTLKFIKVANQQLTQVTH
ncbi:class I SAM-dependent methyltransferase [Bowmanella denitrificans]|uniref:class I SAM-dependent methyltransferase n=1 Tax=Bowmanella denitrificans TaxID=366582 RepID=UPI000C99CD19|nr:methyltransferase domain-containing protein [Bowmanella denitrificans]